MIAIYLLQIVALLGCIVLIARARKSFNGLARGLILLSLLLIVRRIDDVSGLLGVDFFNDVTRAAFSSVVVMVFCLDIWRVYRLRDLYDKQKARREAQIAMLEAARKRSERGHDWDQEPHYERTK